MKKILISILFAAVSIASFSQSLFNRWVPTSGTDTYTTNITALTSYNNSVVYVKFGNTNTGAATININSIGAAPIRKWDGSAWVVLSGSEIDVNTIYKLSYQNGGTYYELEGLGSGGGGSQSLQDVITVSPVLTGANAVTSDDDVTITSDDGAGNVASFGVRPGVESYISKSDAGNTSVAYAVDGEAGITTDDLTNTYGDASITVSTDGQNVAGMTSRNEGATSVSAISVTPTTFNFTLNNSTGSNGDIIKKVGGAWVFSPDAGAAGLTVGTTTITSGTNTRVLYDNSGVVGEYAVSGTGSVAMTSAPTFTNPVVGTQTQGDNSTKAASTAYVDAGLTSVAGYTSTAPEIVSYSITGQLMKGRTLTYVHFFRDIDGTSEGATTYQWWRANDAIGTGAVAISGATSATYVLQTADNTKWVLCIGTPVNSLGEVGTAVPTSYYGPIDDTFWPADQASVVLSYGVKKMAVAYAGNCLQIQSTNGGATNNIGFDGNGDLDWAAISTITGGANTTLKIWYDQSGNGFNMVFTAFANQPVINITGKRIEWGTANNGFATHNSTMDIGTGDFSFFMEAAPRSLKDITFTYFEKKTSFSANNIQLYSPIGYGNLMYTGNASTNTLQAKYSNPNRRTVIAGYRSSTAKFLNTDMQITTASETATNLTSTNNINFNTGDGGTGQWYMWSYTLYKANYGADYSKYKKFVSPN